MTDILARLPVGHTATAAVAEQGEADERDDGDGERDERQDDDQATLHGAIVSAPAVRVQAPTSSAVKVACHKCYGVLFVGQSRGKHYCNRCRLWTRTV